MKTKMSFVAAALLVLSLGAFAQHDASAKAKSADAVTKAHWQMLARQIEAGLKELK